MEFRRVVGVDSQGNLANRGRSMIPEKVQYRLFGIRDNCTLTSQSELTCLNTLRGDTCEIIGFIPLNVNAAS